MPIRVTDRELPVAPWIICRFTQDRDIPLPEGRAPPIHILYGTADQDGYTVGSWSYQIDRHGKIRPVRSGNLQGQLRAAHLEQGIFLPLHKPQMELESFLIKSHRPWYVIHDQGNKIASLDAFHSFAP
jgi:hypothetical protein